MFRPLWHLCVLIIFTCAGYAKPLDQRGFLNTELLWEDDGASVYLAETSRLASGAEALTLLLLKDFNTAPEGPILAMQRMDGKQSATLAPQQLAHFDQNEWPKLKTRWPDAVLVRIQYFDSDIALPENPLRGGLVAESPIIEVVYTRDSGQRWQPLTQLWQWSKTDERNTFAEAKALREQLAERKFDLMQLGEIEKNWHKMERDIELERARLKSRQQQEREAAQAAGRLHFTEAFWSAYENSALLRDVFDGRYKAGRDRRHADSFLLAFLKRLPQRCSSFEQETAPLTLPNLDWQTSPAGQVLGILQGDPARLTLSIPSTVQVTLKRLVDHDMAKHSVASLQTLFDELKDEVKPNPILHPKQGLDWWAKAEVNAARWFDEVACDHPAMQQMHDNLLTALGSARSGNTRALRVRPEAQHYDALSRLDANASFDSVRRSCMSYYAFDPLRADWCACIDLSLHRDYLSDTHSTLAHARYKSFSSSFRPLLELGNLEPLGKESHPDWVLYQTLTRCERKVL